MHPICRFIEFSIAHVRVRSGSEIDETDDYSSLPFPSERNKLDRVKDSEIFPAVTEGLIVPIKSQIKC